MAVKTELTKRAVPIIRTAVALFLASFAFTLATDAQQAPEEYQKIVGLAQGYTKERKFEAALEQWAKAYALQPSPQVLAEMGKDYLAVGKTAEADEAFSKVLAEGGEISLDFLHRHKTGQCYGSLIISSRQIRWAGKDKEDSFQVLPREIENIYPDSHYVSTWKVRDITMPLFKLRAANKSWTYEFLLYGQGKYKTETEGWTDKYVVYLDAAELEKARNATQFIIGMLVKLSTPPAASP
jgi:tetratricopeptide (TPR) repeat protein